MALEYVNRQGDRYYFFQGKTKTGKPTYYASRKNRGIPLDQLPEGYEIYEHPERGLVTVRKIPTSRVLPAERDLLAGLTRQLAGMEFFRVDVQGNSLVIYTADLDDGFDRFGELLGVFPGSRARQREGNP